MFRRQLFTGFSTMSSSALGNTARTYARETQQGDGRHQDRDLQGNEHGTSRVLADARTNAVGAAAR
jgi:hypothetical protein